MILFITTRAPFPLSLSLIHSMCVSVSVCMYVCMYIPLFLSLAIYINLSIFGARRLWMKPLQMP